jgi:hypothetical protein
MAVSNFLQWNPAAANQETDSAYSSDTMRSGGAANPSVFPSATANKLFYQLSTFVAALAQALATKGYAMSDSSLSTLTSTMASVITSADLAPYAPLASPALTGTPTAPTQTGTDNSTRLATTAFVKGQGYAPLASPGLTGTPTAPTPAGSDNSVTLATTAFVKGLNYAPLASPALVGSPTAPTPSTGDNSTLLATSAFVKNQNYQAALGFTPVQQGGGATQGTNKIYIGWGTGGLRAQVDSTDLGNIALLSQFAASLGVSGYQKFPSGLILQWGSASISGSGTALGFPIVFPTTVVLIFSNDQGGSGTSGTHTTSCAGTSNSGFNAFALDANGNPAATNLGWFAIGW